MRDECDENPTVNSMPRGLKYSAGHSHDDDLDSVVLVGVVGVSNASSLGRLLLVKSSFDHDLPATWISRQRPWRYHDRFLNNMLAEVMAGRGSAAADGAEMMPSQNGRSTDVCATFNKCWQGGDRPRPTDETMPEKTAGGV